MSMGFNQSFTLDITILSASRWAMKNDEGQVMSGGKIVCFGNSDTDDRFHGIKTQMVDCPYGEFEKVLQVPLDAFPFQAQAVFSFKQSKSSTGKPVSVAVIESVLIPDSASRSARAAAARAASAPAVPAAAAK